MRAGAAAAAAAVSRSAWRRIVGRKSGPLHAYLVTLPEEASPPHLPASLKSEGKEAPLLEASTRSERRVSLWSGLEGRKATTSQWASLLTSLCCLQGCTMAHLPAPAWRLQEESEASYSLQGKEAGGGRRGVSWREEASPLRGLPASQESLLCLSGRTLCLWRTLIEQTGGGHCLALGEEPHSILSGGGSSASRLKDISCFYKRREMHCLRGGREAGKSCHTSFGGLGGKEGYHLRKEGASWGTTS